MKTAAERTQAIEERKRQTDLPVRLWIRDGWQQVDVYQVPVDALLLNADNRRFRAERMLAEEELGRSLDPENNPDDERSVESLLLDKGHRLEGNRIVGSASDDYEALRNDWLRRDQESPLWIRPDGTVRNGNRRLAMIKRLQREGGDTGLQWVNAVILDPEEIDEPALLEMEQREQLTENFKVRYNDIDYLLALREAALHRDVDWFDRDSIEQLAGGLQAMVEKSKGEVVRDLYAIKYMDQFLEDAGQPGAYHKLLRTLERFRDIGRMMMKVEEDYPLEADRILQVLFAAVRAGARHGEIREIRKMFRSDRSRFDNLAVAIDTAETSWDPSGGAPSLASPSPEDLATEEDEDDASEGPGPTVINYPRDDVRAAIETAIDGFGAASQSDVLQILREVGNRLEVLDERDRLERALEDEDQRAAIEIELRRLIEWSSHRRALID